MKFESNQRKHAPYTLWCPKLEKSIIHRSARLIGMLGLLIE